jgi:hypothetical protein
LGVHAKRVGKILLETFDEIVLIEIDVRRKSHRQLGLHGHFVGFRVDRRKHAGRFALLLEASRTVLALVAALSVGARKVFPFTSSHASHERIAPAGIGYTLIYILAIRVSTDLSVARRKVVAGSAACRYGT